MQAGTRTSGGMSASKAQPWETALREQGALNAQGNKSSKNAEITPIQACTYTQVSLLRDPRK